MRLPMLVALMMSWAVALAACNLDWDGETSDAGTDRDTDPSNSDKKDAEPEGPLLDAHVPDGKVPPTPPDAADTGGGHDAAAPPVACTEGGKECDDQAPCNGVETCEDGFCAPGTPPCPNPDAEHCTMLCLPAGDSVSCKVLPKDGDGDQHGDPLCTASDEQGDDCDDGEAAAHPGASEICDALDNDCDGKVDLEDGLSLSSTSKKYVDAASRPDVTWVPTKSYYGVSFALGSVVGFNEFDRGGERIFSTSMKLTDAANTETVYSTAIHWGGDALGLGWVRYREVRFQRLDAGGGLIGTALNPAPPEWTFFGGGLTLGRLGTADWLVFYGCCMSRPGLSARRISPEGEVREPLYAVGQGGTREQVRSVISGDQIATTWVHGDQSQGPALVMKVRWTRRDAELTKLDVDDNVIASTEDYLVPGGINSVITDTPNGYLIAWFDGKTQIAEFDREGAMVCGPTDLGPFFPEGSFPSFNPSDAASGPHGIALVSTGKIADDKHQVDVVHLKPGCKYVQRFTVGESTSATSNANIASAGADGFAAVWQESSSGTPAYFSVYNRVTTATFCRAN